MQTTPSLFSLRRFTAALVLAALTLPLHGQVVTNTADSGPGSLRDAIAAATNGAILTFTNTLSGQTITLTNGQILIDKDLSIDASALPDGIALSGGNTNRIFQVNAGSTLGLDSLTLKEGRAATTGGGAILTFGSLNAARCTFATNTALGDGGAIGNAAYNPSNPVLCTFTNCTFVGNTATNRGGAIWNNGPYATNLISQSTLIGNHASGNFAGGAVRNNNGVVTVHNTIAYGNTPSDLQSAGIEVTGTNIVGAAAPAPGGPGVLLSVDPLLAPLGDFGGPTPTMPPLPGSPAIDAGAPTPLSTDQRGAPRDASPDIGAVEAQLSLVVLNNNDSGSGSLRESIAWADPGATITFSNTLSGQTITLTNGQLLVDKSLTIDGSALSSGIIIDGNTNSRVFEFSSGTTNVLDSLTIQNGRTPDIIATELIPPDAEDGAGILNHGTLTVRRCSLLNNRTGNGADAVDELYGSSSGGNGGGIYNDGTLRVENSTFVGNATGDGGDGGVLGGNILSARDGGDGGGISSETNTISVFNSTFVDNTAGPAGSGLGGNDGSGGGIHASSLDLLENTIVSSNNASIGPDFSGTAAVVAGVNWIGDPNGASGLGTLDVDYFTGDPMLGPLGDNGGPTPTLVPLPGSPAIDAGLATTNTPATDQRGLVRVVGGAVDIGAVESVLHNPVVTTLADSGAGSLRDAVSIADPGATITFTNTLSGQTILLTSGAVVVNKNLTIDASSLAAGISIDGNGTKHILEFQAGTTNVIDSLTLTNGKGAFETFVVIGGGIHNDGTLTVDNCRIVGNHGPEAGAGIRNTGSLTLNNSTVSDNDGGTSGGGISSSSSGILVINHSTISSNTAGFHGGISAGGLVTLNNSTVSGNSVSGPGGGIRGNPIILNHSTVSANTSGSGGGGVSSATTIFSTNSIIAGNIAPTNANIFGTLSGPNNLTNGTPLLAPLGDYGGPTLTMLPLPGSPAVDMGGVTTLTNDQRGLPRLSGEAVDIGAVEVQLIAGSAPVELTDLTSLGGGTFQFGFTNDIGASFRVLATNNITVPLSNWTFIGWALETPPGSGQFEFTDPDATNYTERYYGVKSP